jgi:hypothetical protein
MDEINPFNLFRRLMRGWWMIVILMILGAVGGMIAGKLLPPVYVAQAEYFVSLNETMFAAEHKLEIVGYADRKEPLSAVSSIFYSENVTSAVVAYAEQHDIELPDAPFWRTFRLDRYYTNWILSVRHTDPQIAAGLVNTWLETADRFVQDALQHANLYNQLNLEVAGIQSCFSGNNLQDGNLCAGTSFTSIDEMLAYLDNLNERLAAEEEASQGVSYATHLEIVAPAEIPADPSRNSLGVLILSGCFIGWLAGLVLVIQRREKGALR